MNIIEIEMRNLRQSLLLESDCTQLADFPISNKEEWAVYRQLLRDITKDEFFPFSVSFPEKPKYERIVEPTTAVEPEIPTKI